MSPELVLSTRRSRKKTNAVTIKEIGTRPIHVHHGEIVVAYREIGFIEPEGEDVSHVFQINRWQRAVNEKITNGIILIVLDQNRNPTPGKNNSYLNIKFAKEKTETKTGALLSFQFVANDPRDKIAGVDRFALIEHAANLYAVDKFENPNMIVMFNE